MSYLSLMIYWKVNWYSQKWL